MNSTIIITIIVGALFVAGCLVASHYGTKATIKYEEEAKNKKNK